VGDVLEIRGEAGKAAGVPTDEFVLGLVAKKAFKYYFRKKTSLCLVRQRRSYKAQGREAL
jgi:hypothetical protein